MATRSNAGGGHGSRVVVDKPVRTGRGSMSTRPAGTAQIGTAIGDHVTHRGDSTGYEGERLHNPERNFNPTKFGNELATNVGRGGPGAGRTLHGQAGSQGMHGQVAGSRRPQGRGILNNE